MEQHKFILNSLKLKELINELESTERKKGLKHVLVLIAMLSPKLSDSSEFHRY